MKKSNTSLQFINLRQGQTKFGLAPHKPIFLLAMVEGFEKFSSTLSGPLDADRLVLRKPDSVEGKRSVNSVLYSGIKIVTLFSEIL